MILGKYFRYDVFLLSVYYHDEAIVNNLCDINKRDAYLLVKDEFLINVSILLRINDMRAWLLINWFIQTMLYSEYVRKQVFLLSD